MAFPACHVAGNCVWTKVLLAVKFLKLFPRQNSGKVPACTEMTTLMKLVMKFLGSPEGLPATQPHGDWAHVCM